MVAQDAVPLEQATGISYLTFNQDQTCVAAATHQGFRIYSTEDFVVLHREDCGAVSLVEMLFCTSLVALVGCSSKETPASSSKCLTMWNTKERSSICQLHFDATIHGVRMNNRRIVVLQRRKIHILDLQTMKTLRVIDRAPAPWADPSLAWLCAAADRGFLATPLALPCTKKEGQDAPSARPGGERLGLVALVDTHTLRPAGLVLAHRSPVQALCLDPSGRMLATASSKGTVVRVFAVPSLQVLCSFRRGANVCRVFGLAFSRDSLHLSAAAASGTLHIFRVSEARRSDCASLQVSERKAAAASGTTEAWLDAPIRLGPFPADDAELDEFDESDWHFVDDETPPERLLALQAGEGEVSDDGVGRGALQAIVEASELAAQVTAKCARSLARARQLLPQPCEELLAEERAFAWAKVRGEERRPRAFSDLRLAVLGAEVGENLEVGYLACANSVPARAGGRSEVLVADARGGARVYEWDPDCGGECHLRMEHSLVGKARAPLQH